MAVSAPPYAIQQYLDDNGLLLAGGTITFCVAGSNTPLAAYADSAGSTPVENPLTLNSSGRVEFWLTQGQAYKLILQDADGVVIKTIDGIRIASDGLSHEVSGYWPGSWTTTTPLLVRNFAVGVTYPQNFVGSVFTVDSYPADQRVISVQDADDVEVGTITIPTSGAIVPATVSASGVEYAAAGQLRLVPPSGGLGTAEGLSVTLLGQVS